MKFIFPISFLLFFLLNTQLSFAFNENKSPSDSGTNIINKTAAILMFEEGKNIFFEGKYREALIKFKDAAIKDKFNAQIFLWIGKCHYELHNYGYAKQYAIQSKELSKEESLDMIILKADAHHQLNEIDSALLSYEILLEKLPKQRSKDLRTVEKIASCKFVQEQIASTKFNQRKAFQESINTGYNEYAPIITNGGKTLYFTARRENTLGGKSNPDDNQYFEDNYRAVWNENTNSWDSISNQLERLNSEGFDCISYLSADGIYGLMTVNTTATNQKVKTMGSDIYEITFSNKGKWQTPKLLKNKSINSSFFDGAATKTADGNTMYFVSDRKGDKSMTDIYVVEKINHKWGEAKPVSDSINTPFNETTPFITPDGRYLFFSSNGHLGMGGYDIFVSENMGSVWTKPINLGIQINTVNDDTHFQYYAKLKKAVSAGFNLQDLKGQLDLFEYDLNQLQLPIK